MTGLRSGPGSVGRNIPALTHAVRRLRLPELLQRTLCVLFSNSYGAGVSELNITEPIQAITGVDERQKISMKKGIICRLTTTRSAR